MNDSDAETADSESDADQCRYHGTVHATEARNQYCRQQNRNCDASKHPFSKHEVHTSMRSWDSTSAAYDVQCLWSRKGRPLSSLRSRPRFAICVESGNLGRRRRHRHRFPCRPYRAAKDDFADGAVGARETTSPVHVPDLASGLAYRACAIEEIRALVHQSRCTAQDAEFGKEADADGA